ncbi:hypothetical protein [Cumulibacter soli]|uniref:hypothetical protein n=1 Tax=Cumulibacter soli TaxID=2546344 RepID=UPI0010671D7B|nr:hypothetical protein [Cumulibacter soli]
MNTEDHESLRARVAELEDQNAQLRESALRDDQPGRSRGRSIISAILLTLSVILVPVAVLGTWARVQLVDTDRFVSTFGPLIDEPEVQDLITEQVTTAIEGNLEIDEMVTSVVDAINELGLPPAAQTALETLEGPAAQGIRSLIDTAVERVVTSEAFASVWNTALRESHSRAIAIIQDQPGTAVSLSDDGALAIELDVVISQVRQELIDRGFGFASAIPQVHRTIPLAQADSLTTVRVAYQAADSVGYWLPWIVLGLAAAGIAIARRHMAALLRTACGYLIALLVLAAALAIGRQIFLGSVAPSIMPRSTADVAFSQVTTDLYSVTAALIVLAICLVVGAWLAGGSSSARTARRTGNRVFGAVRAASEQHGLSTKGFGRILDSWHNTILIATVAIAVFVVFVNRPVSTGSVITALIVVAVVAVLLESLRRPPNENHPPSASAVDDDKVGAEAQSVGVPAPRAVTEPLDLASETEPPAR